MLFSLALIFLCALALSGVMQKLKLPGLLGMLLTGIILGPYTLNLIAPEILNISADLRQAALIVILVRAGLSLNVSDLKKVGKPAFLLCFIPATIEIFATIMLAPLFFNITRWEAALMGVVLAAVSPAIIIPKMIKLTESGHGKNKRIPQLIMAGTSVTGVYVIVLFTALMGADGADGFGISNIVTMPVAVAFGLLAGVLSGIFLVWVFNAIRMNDTVKAIVVLCSAFMLVALEAAMPNYVPMFGLIGAIAMGGTILKKHDGLAKRVSAKFSKIWIPAEIVLFVLVGATMNMQYATQYGLAAVALIFGVLAVRLAGVLVCLAKTNLNIKERLFCCIAYVPKATVQAAIGGIPLAMGVAAGHIILTVAVLAILITAPLGALGIDIFYKKCLEENK